MIEVKYKKTKQEINTYEKRGCRRKINKLKLQILCQKE